MIERLLMIYLQLTCLHNQINHIKSNFSNCPNLPHVGMDASVMKFLKGKWGTDAIPNLNTPMINKMSMIKTRKKITSNPKINSSPRYTNSPFIHHTYTSPNLSPHWWMWADFSLHQQKMKVWWWLWWWQWQGARSFLSNHQCHPHNPIDPINHPMEPLNPLDLIHPLDSIRRGSRGAREEQYVLDQYDPSIS